MLGALVLMTEEMRVEALHFGEMERLCVEEGKAFAKQWRKARFLSPVTRTGGKLPPVYNFLGTPNPPLSS